MQRVALSSTDVVRHAGCTYRQLDWWTRTGAIVPSIAIADGPGSRRMWSRTDADAVAAITRVVDGFTRLGADVPTSVVTEVWRAFHADPDVRELRLGILTIDLRGRVT